MLAINQSKATSLGISQSAYAIGLHTVLTGFSSDLRLASQSPPANFKAAKRRSVFRLDERQSNNVNFPCSQTIKYNN